MERDFDLDPKSLSPIFANAVGERASRFSTVN